jgi:hypothetical protein
MSNSKSIGVAYADPLFDSLDVSGAVNLTGGDFNITTTSTSTDGATSVEPVSVSTTMTGTGGVGGRAKFLTTINSVLGSYSNALKGEVVYGTSGRTTGLGSAVLAEMTLSAGTSAGNYAPIEIELNCASGASTGTATALIYAGVNGTGAATVDTNGYLLNLAGVTVAGAKLAATGTITNVNEITHGLRVKIAGSDYYLLAATAANFNA